MLPWLLESGKLGCYPQLYAPICYMTTKQHISVTFCIRAKDVIIFISKRTRELITILKYLVQQELQLNLATCIVCLGKGRTTLIMTGHIQFIIKFLIGAECNQTIRYLFSHEIHDLLLGKVRPRFPHYKSHWYLPDIFVWIPAQCIRKEHLRYCLMTKESYISISLNQWSFSFPGFRQGTYGITAASMISG